MASPFSASTRKAGSLEYSGGRHSRFSNRMIQMINSINDDVHPTRGYFDSPAKEPVERLSSSSAYDQRPPRSRRQRYDDEDDQVVTDVTSEYTSNRPPPPQPMARKSITVVSRSQQYDDDEDEGETQVRQVRRKNLDIAPLPESKLRIKSGKDKAPIHIDESNFRESSRPRTSADQQQQQRPARRRSIESLDSSSSNFGLSRRYEDDNRSIDMGADEIEIYPDDDESKSKNPGENAANAKPNFDYPIFKTLVYNTLEFIQTPAPPGCTVKCKLVMSRGVFNEFTLYLEGYAGYDLPILKTRRRRAVPIIYYYIDALYIERNETKDSQTIPFGRLSSNVKRKNFSLVGNRNGDGRSLSGSIQSLNLDEQLNMSSQVINQKKYFDLTYNTKLFGTSKPKEFVVDALINQQAEEPASPRRRDSSRASRGATATTTRDSSENFRRVTKRVTLLNKKAEYDPITKKYRLDFHGRAKAPSANNIQVIDESDTKTILFQLGKVKSKCYYLDYSYPLCAFQALGIAISCLTRN